jgi:hypothetical protein
MSIGCRVGRYRRIGVVVAIIAAVASTVSACRCTCGKTPSPGLYSMGFLTLAFTSQASGVGSGQNRPAPEWQVELRDTSDGHVIRVLYRTSTGIEAVARMSDGSVLVAEPGSRGSCTTRLVRVDPVFAHSTPETVLNGPLEELAVSPDDSSVAYRTWSAATSPCGRSAGLFTPGTDLLAVTNLRTGATRTTSVLAGVSWSPDGTRLIGLDSTGLEIIDATSLARIGGLLGAPADCRYGYPVWTASGIYVDRSCGLRAASATFGTSTVDDIVRLDQLGTVHRAWGLSSCTGARALVTGADRQQVVLQLTTGFGGFGTCSRVHGDEVAFIEGQQIRDVVSLGDADTTLAAD